MIVGRGFVWLRRIGLTALALFVLVPLYAIAITSLVPTTDLDKPFSWWPDDLTLAAFGDMWSTIPLAHYLGNSLVVTICAVLLVLATAIPAGYALARMHFAGRRLLVGALIATQAVSGLLFLLPLVLLLGEASRRSGVTLIGSYPVLVVTAATFALPFSIALLGRYFAAMPADIEDAAHDLGAGPLVTLTKVVLPNARPGIAAVALFAFALSWGEVLFTSVLSDSGTRTVAVGLSGYAGQDAAIWNQLIAAALLTSLPLIAAFAVMRRSLVTGLGTAMGSGE